MRTKQAFCIALVAAMLPSVGFAQPTFNELVARIEAQHPLMHAARAGLASLQAKLDQARWAYFPTFDLAAGIGPTPRVTGDALKSETDSGTWGYLASAKLSMVQPVYTFGKIRSLQLAARQGVDIGDASVDLARFELRYRLAQAWFGMQLANEMSAMLDDGEEWLAKSATRMERLRDEDSDDYDQSEHLRLKSRMAEFFALKAQNELLTTQAEHGLRLLTGEADPDKRVPLPDGGLEILEVDMATPDAFVALALQQDPLMRIKRATARVNAHLHDHKRAQLFPDLVVLAAANATTSDVIEEQSSAFANNHAHQLGGYGLVGLRWTLNVPERIFQKEEASALATMATMDARTSAQQTELNVRRLWQELDNVRVLVGRYEQSKVAADGWLNSNWDLYEDGFAEFNDVMDALEQYYSKRAAYLQSIHDHNILVYALGRAVGLDISRWREPRAASPADAR